MPKDSLAAKAAGTVRLTVTGATPLPSNERTERCHQRWLTYCRNGAG
jgi:hypothetical protein